MLVAFKYFVAVCVVFVLGYVISTLLFKRTKCEGCGKTIPIGMSQIVKAAPDSVNDKYLCSVCYKKIA